eukprot:4076509-Lingulodinium_polyedra.AAC.1
MVFKQQEVAVARRVPFRRYTRPRHPASVRKFCAEADALRWPWPRPCAFELRLHGRARARAQFARRARGAR